MSEITINKTINAKIVGDYLIINNKTTTTQQYLKIKGDSYKHLKTVKIEEEEEKHNIKKQNKNKKH
jgi:hypothetical protein